MLWVEGGEMTTTCNWRHNVCGVYCTCFIMLYPHQLMTSQECSFLYIAVVGCMGRGVGPFL